MGKLIVIEGLDGSGKGTQTKLLFDELIANGINAQKVSFPNYESDASAPVKMYLNGDFGKTAQDVNAYAASVLYSVDRFASYKTEWGDFYHNGGIIVSDRYTTSNAVHQCSKLPKEEWQNYLQWLFELEYNKISIPKPDMVIYLSVDPIVSQELLLKRYDGNEAKKDIHERDVEYLKKSRMAAEFCAEYCGWIKIECAENGIMRTMQSIHDEIKLYVNNII